jgi:hypothetical protein
VREKEETRPSAPGAGACAWRSIVVRKNRFLGIPAGAFRSGCLLTRSLNLAQSSQTTRTKPHPHRHAIFVDGDLLDIRLPLAFGLDSRVANIVPECRRLSTNLTLGHDCTSLAQIEPAFESAGPVRPCWQRSSYHKQHFSANQIRSGARDVKKRGTTTRGGN